MNCAIFSAEYAKPGSGGFKARPMILAAFCLYLYTPIFTKIEYLCYLVQYGSALAYIALNYRLLLRMFGDLRKSDFALLATLVLLPLISYLVPLLHGTGDFSYATVVFAIYRRVLLQLFLITLLQKRYGQEVTVEIYMYYFVLAACAYVIGSVILFVPPLRTLWRSLVNTEANAVLDSVSYYVSRYGWMGFTGFGGTLYCSISVVFALYLIRSGSIDVSERKLLILTILSFLGNLFYGRIGLAASGVCIALVCLLHINKFKRITVLYVLFGIIAVVCVLALMVAFVPAVNRWFSWAITPFINLLTTGSFDNYSFNHLTRDMIFLPEFKTFFLGDGMYTAGDHYYMSTDSGFMRQILFWGIGMTLITYIATIASMVKFGKKRRLLIVMLLIIFAVFEFKGEVYFELLPITFLLTVWDGSIATQRRLQGG